MTYSEIFMSQTCHVMLLQLETIQSSLFALREGNLPIVVSPRYTSFFFTTCRVSFGKIQTGYQRYLPSVKFCNVSVTCPSIVVVPSLLVVVGRTELLQQKRKCAGHSAGSLLEDRLSRPDPQVPSPSCYLLGVFLTALCCSVCLTGS